MEDIIADYIDEEQYLSDDNSILSSEYDFTDDEIDIFENDLHIPFETRNPTPIRWVTINLHSIKLDVSNMGKIRSHKSLYDSTEGIPLHGTPYRIYQIQIDKDKYKNYYIHELIWQAFNGKPPDGWVIRHKCEYTSNKAKIRYNNKLANLTIVPNTMSELYIDKGVSLHNCSE